MSNEMTTSPASFNPLALLPQNMKEAREFAEMMAKSELIPSHLRGKPGDCLMVTMQAYRWMVDPFVVANCTSTVHGRLCYEGKLIAAVLTTMNAIEGPLSYEIKGEGQGASITVTGRPRGGKKDESITGTVRGWRTYGKDRNSGERIENQWDKDPLSMLVYRGTRQWARLYAPAGFLGVYTPDEMADRADEIVVEVVPPSVEVPRKTTAPIQDAEVVQPSSTPSMTEAGPKGTVAESPASQPQAASGNLPFEEPAPTPAPQKARPEPGEPLTDGMQRILKSAMGRLNLSDADLQHEFPAGIGKGNINDAMEWVKSHGQ